jgi:hypothetical protein
MRFHPLIGSRRVDEREGADADPSPEASTSTCDTRESHDLKRTVFSGLVKSPERH